MKHSCIQCDGTGYTELHGVPFPCDTCEMDKLTRAPKKWVMTDRALVLEYKRTHARIDKLYSRLNETVFRDMRPSEMRALPEKPFVVKQLLKQMDLAAELRDEAERRYGPDLMLVDQLIWRRV